MKTSEILGFNYAGSWGATGFDLWQHFDAELMRQEVARGKAYFPGWNAVRWWLDQSAFQRDPGRFMRNLETGLGSVVSTCWRMGLCAAPSCNGSPGWPEPCAYSA